MDENHNENNVIDDINNNSLNIVCVAQTMIKNKKK